MSAQSLNGFNRINIVKSVDSKIDGIITKVFEEKGFEVNKNTTELSQEDSLRTIHCYYLSGKGRTNYIIIGLYDSFGHEIMDLYGEGSGYVNKALKPIIKMQYEYQPVLNKLPRKDIITEDSARTYLSTVKTGSIEGIYIALDKRRCEKVAIIKSSKNVYNIINISFCPRYPVFYNIGDTIATLQWIRDSFYKGGGKLYMRGVDNNKKEIKEIDIYAQYDNEGMLIRYADNSIYWSLAKMTLESNNKEKTPETTIAEKWSGTGFALNNGYLVTNNHVIEGANSITVYGINGDHSKGYTANLIGTDKVNDLALLRIISDDFSGFSSVPYSISSNMSETGEEIFVLGYPLTQIMGNEIKLTNGIISSRSGFDGNVNNYQMSAPVQPGNSGGPMFDKQGNVVGVVVAGINNGIAQNANYAIKTSCLRNLIESVANLSILPNGKSLSNKSLIDQVKLVKNYVFYIECTK